MTTINLNGKEREIKFSLRAWKILEDKYGTVFEALEHLQKDMSEKPFNTIPYLIFITLKDKTDEETESKIIDYMDDCDFTQLQEYVSLITKAMIETLPKVSKGDSKNSSKVKK